ncbi:hypothetical protein LCGC14_1087530 [marine sediment metagenome]|uniref:DUF927 domain-containing protein n=1 Tax=marine sediment metagenome TaxID=412755 RepID=A0A0F9MHS4_9ZZZZ
MKLSDFLNAVVPEGTMVIGKKAANFRHTVCKSQAVALATIKKLAGSSDDIYFALATFKQGFHTNAKGKKVLRVRENISQLKALWFDIDFKDGLSDPTVVVAALREFSNATGMPAPSILVHSGNGVHVYWTLTESVPYARWQPMANKLKELALGHKLSIDSVCTADGCRVLRPPGTRNFKDPLVPKPVYFLYDRGRLYDPAALEVALAGVLPNAQAGVGGVDDGLGSVPAYAKGLLGNVQEFSGAGVGSYAPVESFFAQITGECGVAKHWAVTKGSDCTEPEWTAALQLLKHCTDGELWVHELSSGHSDYDADSTNEKFARRKENNAGPTLCRTLSAYRPDICAACPHNGKIKTPIVLGVEVTVQTAGGIALTSWRINPDGRGMDRKMLNPDTMLYEWLPALRRVFENVNATESVLTKFFELHFKVRMQGAKDIQIILPTGHLGNDNKLRETMASFGAPLRGSELTPFKDFMGTWLEKLQKERDIASVTEQLGWVKDSDGNVEGFSAGTTTYMSDGTEKIGVRIAKEFLAVGRMYEVSGTKAPWLRVSKFLAEQNNPAFTAIIASAFAAPLLSFTGVQGSILSLVSTESGVGKTSALKCAQAVWGSPTHGMNSIEDTRLSVARKLGFLNNLPAYWDELRGEKTMEEFCHLAFQVAQGKEKSRLDSTATMRDVNTWETMVIAASNESIFDLMGSYSAGSDAGVARTYEIIVHPFESERSRAEIAMLFETLNGNYGHAGQEYAKYLAMHHKEIKVMVGKMFSSLSAQGQMKPQERFWFSMMTSLIIGAGLAKKIGLVDIDVRTLGHYLLKNVTQLRTRSSASMLGSTPSELIAAYMQQHQDKGLIVDKLSRQGHSYTPSVISPPRADRIIFQLAQDDNVVRVAKGDFCSWLKRSKGINWSSVAESFKKDLYLSVAKTSLGLGTKWAMPRQYCMDMTLEFGEKK